ncbi:MarR family winged helix-turn-helix transcriptional regulator [Salinarimonas rosea]|uniref:MarR family winged helix-turn-helix transcriptional regulator n=1 Tax=Salinarimonas rosea TaxID=552063 RepID=UPI0004156FC0|nr:MarR family transcriptional regulator [Salinarimonas rosea]
MEGEGSGSAAHAGATGDPLVFRLINEIAIIDQLASRLFERVMPGDLTLPQFVVLNHFVRLGRPSSPLRLARAFQVTKSTMTNTLQHLDRAGWVTITPDPADARAKVVFITEAGRAAREAAIAALAPRLAGVARGISPAEVEAALPLLARLRANLDAERDTPHAVD